MSESNQLKAGADKHLDNLPQSPSQVKDSVPASIKDVTENTGQVKAECQSEVTHVSDAPNQTNSDGITKRSTTTFQQSSENIKFWDDIKEKIHSTYRAAKRRQNFLQQNPKVS